MRASVTVLVCSGGTWDSQLVSWFGLAVRRWAGKPRDLGLNPFQLSFLFKSCGLWMLSCDFVPCN